MDVAQLKGLNYGLALSAESCGLRASAKEFEGDDDHWLELTAEVWVDGQRLEYTENILVCELQSMPASAIAKRFVELASRILPAQPRGPARTVSLTQTNQTNELKRNAAPRDFTSDPDGDTLP
jgi:hypothetical protein